MHWKEGATLRSHIRGQIVRIPSNRMQRKSIEIRREGRDLMIIRHTDGATEGNPEMVVDADSMALKLAAHALL